MKPELVLALDYGTRRIGVAIADTLTGLARPLTTLDAHPMPWQELQHLVAEYTPRELVVGVPYNADGSATGLTRPAQEFARQVETRLGLTVHRVNEHLSSRDAEADLRDARAAGHKRRRVKHADVDSAAAKVILERWLAQRM